MWQDGATGFGARRGCCRWKGLRMRCTFSISFAVFTILVCVYQYGPKDFSISEPITLTLFESRVRRVELSTALFVTQYPLGENDFCQGGVNRNWGRGPYFSVDLWSFSGWCPHAGLKITKGLFGYTCMLFLNCVSWNTQSLTGVDWTNLCYLCCSSKA